MKRNLIALAALTSMVSAVALADTANVNVYGTLNISYTSQSFKTVADEDTSALRLVCNSCNFGLKGTEDITDGVKGIWQIEQGFGGAGGFNVTTNLMNRNSGLGVSGEWGTFMFGQWDTPFKTFSAPLEPNYGTGVGYMVPMTHGFSTATHTTLNALGANTDAQELSFARRQNSSIWYNSPKFAGADFSVQYSGSGAKNSTHPHPLLISAAARWSNDMIFAAASYELHQDGRATSATVDGTNDTGIGFMAGVKPIDGLTLGAAWTSLKLGNDVAGQDADDTLGKKSGLLATAVYKLDKWDLAFSYGTAGDVKTETAGVEATTADSGASQITAKIGYNYSKRTAVYAVYSGINNDAAASYTWALSADTYANSGSVTGTDYSAIGVGIRHTF